MARQSVAVVRTGTANTASVLAAFERLGIRAGLTDEQAAVREQAYVVLPGVGTFGAAMAALREARLIEALQDRLRRGRPTLAICLGMQLLGSGSAENPGLSGLGLFDRTAREFPPGQSVPKLGWNRVEAGPGCDLLRAGHAYFAHSYCLETVPDCFETATAEYGLRYVAAFERDTLLACQFHPELSGEFGQALLRRWLVRGGAGC